mgnify:CR=1 FL=1
MTFRQDERFRGLLVPLYALAAAALAAELYCRRRSAMLIMDPPAAWQAAADAIAGIRNAGYASPNMLTYFPRLATGGSEGIRTFLKFSKAF